MTHLHDIVPQPAQPPIPPITVPKCAPAASGKPYVQVEMHPAGYASPLIIDLPCAVAQHLAGELIDRAQSIAPANPSSDRAELWHRLHRIRALAAVFANHRDNSARGLAQDIIKLTDGEEP
jgi:hypothetical protein